MATYVTLDGSSSPDQQVAREVHVALDSASVVEAINKLTAEVRAFKPEIRIDLPAMSPVIQPSQVPVSVTVPDFPSLPPNAPVTVNVPEAPPTLQPPAPKIALSVALLAGGCLMVGQVLAMTLIDAVRFYLGF